MELQNFCQEDCLASRIIRRDFARQRLKIMMSVMDRVRLVRWKACFFVFNGYDAVFCPPRDRWFRQGFVFGTDNEAASKILVSKSWWEYCKFAEKAANV